MLPLRPSRFFVYECVSFRVYAGDWDLRQFLLLSSAMRWTAKAARVSSRAEAHAVYYRTPLLDAPLEWPANFSRSHKSIKKKLGYVPIFSGFVPEAWLGKVWHVSLRLYIGVEGKCWMLKENSQTSALCLDILLDFTWHHIIRASFAPTLFSTRDVSLQETRSTFICWWEEESLRRSFFATHRVEWFE